MSGPTPTFLDRPLFRLAGLSRIHTYAEGPTTIPPQWDEFAQSPFRLASNAGTYFGASYDFNPATATFSYLSGIEVPSFEDLPASISRLVIPTAHYAVFTHTDGLATIGKTWRFIMEQWLPSTGNKHAPTPDFELYDDRLMSDPTNGAIEIWIPLTR